MTKFPKMPFSVRDAADFVSNPQVVCEKVKGGYVALRFLYGVADEVQTVEVPFDQIGQGWRTPGTQYHLDGEATSGGAHGLAKTHLGNLKLKALKFGATPDAIRLFRKVVDLTKQEEAIMADAKLKSKAAKAKEAKPKATKPVGGGGKAAATKPRRGNPEALAKARAARAEAGPDVRKITILKKENPYREGSNRAKSWDALKGAKTVEDYKNAGGAVKYIGRWISEGRIKAA